MAASKRLGGGAVPLSDYHGNVTSGSMATRPVASASKSVGSSAGGASLHDSSELAVGMIIEHQIFGRGTIEEIDREQPDHRIRVTFDNTGQKVLMLKFARFKIV